MDYNNGREFVLAEVDRELELTRQNEELMNFKSGLEVIVMLHRR